MITNVNIRLSYLGMDYLYCISRTMDVGMQIFQV